MAGKYRRGRDPRGMSVECKLARNSIPLPSGCVTWAGSVNDQGYGTISIDGRNYRAHRVMWETFGSPLAASDIVDHRCGNRSCVSIDHLRVVTKAENTQYRVKLNRNNKTGHRGVAVNAQGTYSVWVMANGERHYEQGFATAEEANEYALALRAKHHLLGEFSPEL